MKIKSQKQLYFIFIISSLVIAGFLTLFIKQSNLPFELRIDKKELRESTNITDMYTDLDSDGISEKIKVSTITKVVNTSLTVFNNKGLLIDQFNLFSFSYHNWLHFEDYNDDNFKEIFAFSHLNDSLFLSVIDVKKQQYILHREFIISKPDSAKTEKWDIFAESGKLLNLDNDKAKEFIFSINSGFTIYPRSVYTYDIKDKKIINTFETGAAFSSVNIEDFNNDGQDEIIVSSNAYSNTTEARGYHDQTNWLFVLNKDLKPIFSPKNFGKYPSESYATTIKSKGENRILFSYETQNDLEHYSTFLLFNSEGEIVDTLKHLSEYYSTTFKTFEKGEEFLFLRSDSELIKLNANFEIVESNHFYNQSVIPICEIELETQSKKAILGHYQNKLLLFDRKLKLLLEYNLLSSAIGYSYYPIKSKNKLSQFALISEKSNYLFTIVENKISTYLPLVFLGFALFFFLFFIGLHKILSFLSTYIKYFGYSLNKSSKGVALFNSSGNLFYSNANINNYLHLSNSINKKESFKEVFYGRNDVLLAIENSLSTHDKVNKELHISTADYQFEGSLTITPFTSFIGFTYAYLLEVSDFTEPLLTDRGKVWGATLQRIAHEIKTPLSTLILSLDNLKNTLVGKNVDVNEEINMMQNELERIKQLTKNFMMFTNLEEQKVDKVSISKVLSESINNFSSYFEKGMTLKFEDNDYYVLADERQLTQLFPLLIENAIDACDGKGEIDVRCVRLRKDNYAWIGEPDSEVNKNEYVKIIISDNGKGMSKEVIEKIFEPYFTTKKDGTGMGLSLAKKIIEDNRGKIEIKSEIDKGTEVIIYFIGANLPQT